MTKMHNPPHPGAILRELCLTPLGLTVTAAADGLGVTRKALSELLNGHSGISPEMAIRLSKAFGGSPAAWLKMQVDYDLAQVEKTADKKDYKIIIVKGAAPTAEELESVEAAPEQLVAEQGRGEGLTLRPDDRLVFFRKRVGARQLRRGQLLLGASDTAVSLRARVLTLGIRQRR